MKNHWMKLKIGLMVGIVFLLLFPNTISGSLERTHTSIGQDTPITLTLQPEEKTSSFTFYMFGKKGIEKHNVLIGLVTAQKIYNKYKEIIAEMESSSSVKNMQCLQAEFGDLLQEAGIVPQAVTKNQIIALLTPPVKPKNPFTNISHPLQGKASEWFCNFATSGEGAAFPIIILPRFIPFILTPIPRAFVYWSTPNGITSVGGLISQTGFVAYGQQKGIALGFWGVGFSIFLPPINAYGIFGYALYSRVNADYIEFWPPNSPPEITQTDPADGQEMVPVSSSELRFSIQDGNGDLMSYTVTTSPDIGSGSGGLKTDGVYSIPLSGLESFTTYSCSFQLTDGKDTIEKTISFTTEPTEPIISNPLPEDTERDVPMNLLQLQFTLKDYQGDAMEYTVQTSPDIGSKHETGVHDGTFTVAISGMTYGAVYRWYANVTDGVHWTRKTFSFSTGYPSPFDPFDYGWHYRKQIIIDHAQVAGNLENFPVLLSTIDPDLMKAQSDGDDLLFMNGVGSARKLRHEIETFNQETGTLIAWVNISALSSSHDTEFYLYYGNPSCINQQYPEKVWTSSFVAVWHLNNNPTGQIFDSTKNKNNGNAAGGMTTVDLVNGKIGSCLHFDGFDDLISFSEFTGTLNRGTCVAWVQTTSTQRGIVWSEATKTAIKPYILCGKYYDDDFWFARDLSGGDSNYQGMRPMTMNNGQWHQVAWLSYGSGIGNMFYFDGQPITLLWQDDLNPQGLWFDDQPTNTHSIAALDRSTDGCFWMGLLDEIRIISTPLSDAWISTEFANQNTPSSFVTIGPEETGP